MYSSVPMRKKPRSSSRTAQASTRSRVSCVGRGQVGLDLLAQPRQRAGEADHVVELLGVAPGAPRVVVAVLLAARGVDPRGLQVAVRVRADPDVLPGGRDAELADALEHLGLVDALAVVVEVREAAARAPAGDPGAGAVGAAEPGHFSSLPMRARGLGLRACRGSHSRPRSRGAARARAAARGARPARDRRALEPELARLAEEPGVDVVALDLRELDFLDSSGLRAVVLAARRCWSQRPPAGARARPVARSARLRAHAHDRAARVRRRA